MTSYDPFSYGQVQVGGDKSPDAAPDDILFANGGKAADSSWELLEQDVSGLLPGAAGMTPAEFGDDILGAAPARPAAPAPQVRARPAAVPRPKPAATGRPESAVPPRPPVVRAPTPAPVAKATAPQRPPVRASRSGLLGWIVPILVFAGGGSVAAWLYAMQQNHVLGGIVVGLSVVAATFARVFYRS